jgi:hypothetical protein
MQFSERYKFADWPNKDIPKVAAGIYAIWNGAELFYCGMSGREVEKNRHKKKYGMVTRLHSHSTGRLSGDQFWVYVANRLVIPSLKQNDLTLFASGELKLDTLTKRYIHHYLEYQYLLVDSSAEAYSIEIKARNGELFGQKPKLNPIGI